MWSICTYIPRWMKNELYNSDELNLNNLKRQGENLKKKNLCLKQLGKNNIFSSREIIQNDSPLYVVYLLSNSLFKVLLTSVTVIDSLVDISFFRFAFLFLVFCIVCEEVVRIFNGLWWGFRFSKTLLLKLIKDNGRILSFMNWFISC